MLQCLLLQAQLSEADTYTHTHCFPQLQTAYWTGRPWMLCSTLCPMAAASCAVLSTQRSDEHLNGIYLTV